MRLSWTVILFIIIVPLLFSFSFFKSRAPDYEGMANKITAKVAKNLAKKHQMSWIGEGGGMMGSIYMISLSFQVRHPMDRDEARARIVDCVEELLAAINANEEIRPFLKNYPFTTKNIYMSIFSSYADGSDVFDPYIRVVSVYKNDYVTFSTMELDNKSYKSRNREPYAEALAYVKKKNIDNHSIER